MDLLLQARLTFESGPARALSGVVCGVEGRDRRNRCAHYETEGMNGTHTNDQ